MLIILMNSIQSFFSNSGFMPHIHCYLDRSSLVWAMVVTDTLIGVSYVVISATLYSLVRKVKLPFHVVFLAFGLFILACGATHFMEVYNLWVPNYWLSAFIKAITAVASIATAVYLLKLYPHIITGMEAAKEIAQTKETLESYFKSKLSSPPEMKRLLSRTTILPMLLAGGLAVISISQALYIQSVQHLVDHSNKIMLGANGLHRESIEADSALRRYLLTGNKTHLASMQDYQQKYMQTLSSLRELVSDSPVQSETLQKKEAIFNRWKEYASRSTTLSNGSNMKVFMAFVDEGQHLRETHRNLFQKFVNTEQELQSERARTTRRASLLFLITTVGFTMLIGMIFGTLGRKTLLDISSSYGRALSELKKALTYRDEFIAIASHELKTPITSLNLQLQLTKRSVVPEKNLSPSPEKLAKFLDISTIQVDRMANLVNELLDVSRINAGKLNLHFEKVNLNDLINENIERLSEQSKMAKSDIIFDEPKTTLTVWGDRFRLDQVFINLLTNAIKYGSGKPIKVSGFYSSDRQRVSITVQDHGVGISKEDQAKIFESFERAASVEKVSGLGLGLHIARQIVLAHQGEITVESELGLGSIFTTTLPSGGGLK